MRMPTCGTLLAAGLGARGVGISAGAGAWGAVSAGVSVWAAPRDLKNLNSDMA